MSTILVISDSLALPRCEPEVVFPEQTYPSLLNNRYGTVINCAYGGSTSNNIIWQARYFNKIMLNGICILNFGIVDCTPRVFTKYEAWILRKLNIRIPFKIAKWLRKRRLVRKVDPKKFRDNCNEIKNMALGNLIIVPIAPASSNFEVEVPGIKSSIELYNSILFDEFSESVCQVPLNPAEHIMSDYHHLNAAGHRLVYEVINTKIQEILNI